MVSQRDELIEALRAEVIKGRPRVQHIHRNEWPKLWDIIEALCQSEAEEVNDFSPFPEDDGWQRARVPIIDLDSRSVRDVEVEIDRRGGIISFREIERDEDATETIVPPSV